MPRESHPTPPPTEIVEVKPAERTSVEKDSARSLHEAATEWLELSREYQELARSPWHVEKRRTDKVPMLSFKDRLKAIAKGNSADLLDMMTMKPAEGEPHGNGNAKDQDRLRLLAE